MNSQKLNGIGRWLKIAIEVSILLFAVGIAWATLRGEVKDNIADIQKSEVRMTACEEDVSEVKADIREIRVEQKYISKGIDQIVKKLDR